jgi:3-hydroxy-9,10-secoandrosta-1,3,5(10)-triene-9,17-dione monooxygenase reductase component
MARDMMDGLPDPLVDPTEFRRVMGKFPTGVALVTASDGGRPFGMAMNSLTSLSLDPCLVLVCPRKGSATGGAIRASGSFAISLLESSQGAICERFVGRTAPRFDGLDVDLDRNGSPLIPGAVGYLSCRLHAVYPGGDHEIIVGEVINCRHVPGAPLVYHDGRMARLAA